MTEPAPPPEQPEGRSQRKAMYEDIAGRVFDPDPTVRLQAARAAHDLGWPELADMAFGGEPYGGRGRPGAS